MSQIRVLQVIPSLDVAGAETMVTNLSLALDRSSFHVSILSLFSTPQTPLARALSEAEIPLHFLNKKIGFDPLTFQRLEGVIRRVRPDVIHTHLGAIRYALPSLVLRPYIARIHTLHIVAEEDATLPLVNRIAFSLGVEPIAIAQAVADSIERLYGIPDPTIVPNGIPVEIYKRPTVPRDEWRRSEGMSTSDFAFVNVGRLMEQKNQALLIEAFARVAVEIPHATLLVAGEGPLRRELEGKVRASGLADRVRFLGLRLDISSVLGASDAFVLSSRSEGNPLCVMEAMAAGLPVVSTSVGGVPELVEDDRSGLLVEPGDTVGLSAAMLALARDPSRAAMMGRAAFARASEQFDVSVMARAYETVYERRLSRCRRRAGAQAGSG